LLKKLQDGSGHRHFKYLFNSSIFCALDGGVEPRPGTTSNEAEHRIVKGWAECVTMQHGDRLQMAGELFGLSRLLLNEVTQTASSAVRSLKRTRLVALMAGLVARGALSPPCVPASDDDEPDSAILKKPAAKSDDDAPDCTIRKRPAAKSAVVSNKPASRAALRTPVVPLEIGAVAARKQRKQQHKEAFAKHVSKMRQGRSGNPIRLLHRLRFKQPPPHAVTTVRRVQVKKSGSRR